MFDREYTFGITTVYCDTQGCNSEQTVEGFDGHCLPSADVVKEIKEYGWTVKNGEHFCSLCRNNTTPKGRRR